MDTFSSRWKRKELNLNMERLSLAFSKMVTVLSEEQLLGHECSIRIKNYDTHTSEELNFSWKHLLMMRLHLFLSVEYGVGVAQQLLITTLNLKAFTWVRDLTAFYFLMFFNLLMYLLLRPFASMPIKTSEPISDVSIT